MWFVIAWTALCGAGLLAHLIDNPKPKLTQWEAIQAELQRRIDASEGRHNAEGGEWIIAAGVKVTGWFCLWLTLGVPAATVNLVTRKTG